MSDATFQLLTSSEFVGSIVVGALGVVVVLVWAVIARAPFPCGGVVLVAGVAVAIARTEVLPIGLVIGLGLLAFAGLIPMRSPLGTMTLVAPGAVVVAMSQISDTRSTSAWLVVLAIVLLAPLVASFDDRFAVTTVSVPLIAISMVSVFLTVPDTEFAVLAAGASLAWLVAGPPAKLARLGSSGSFAAVAMLVWLVATGGSGSPLVLLAGLATLGVLAIEPIVASLREGSTSGLDAKETITKGSVVAITVAHVGIQALIAIVIRA